MNAVVFVLRRCNVGDDCIYMFWRGEDTVHSSPLAKDFTHGPPSSLASEDAVH